MADRAVGQQTAEAISQPTAEAIRTAYAIAVKTPADMTTAELREHIEMQEKLIVCLRAEVHALDTMAQQVPSQGGEDGKSMSDS